MRIADVTKGKELFLFEALFEMQELLKHDIQMILNSTISKYAFK